jgi:hypothetical protein
VDALAYLMYLLRSIDFQGTLLTNPYTASVARTVASSKSVSPARRT